MKEQDLSYSGIVNELQGDREKAQEMLLGLTRQLKLYGDQIGPLKDKMEELSNKISANNAGIIRVMKHMQMNYPFAVSDPSNKTVTVYTGESVNTYPIM